MGAVYNSGGLNYIRHMDYLGSSRLATTWAHSVYAKESYAPFGEPYNETSTHRLRPRLLPRPRAAIQHAGQPTIIYSQAGIPRGA
jgi:hypothetical protein